MKKYNKPIVLINTELAEGVYAASGNTPWHEEICHYIIITSHDVKIGTLIEILFDDGTSVIKAYTEYGIPLTDEEYAKRIIKLRFA